MWVALKGICHSTCWSWFDLQQQRWKCSSRPECTYLICMHSLHKTKTLWCVIQMFFWKPIASWGATQWCSWLRHCAKAEKDSCLIPDWVNWIFHCLNRSSRTMAPRSTQPLTEMSTKYLSWKVLRAHNLLAFICQMSENPSWSPRGLSRPVQGKLYLITFWRTNLSDILQTLLLLPSSGKNSNSKPVLLGLLNRATANCIVAATAFFLSDVKSFEIWHHSDCRYRRFGVYFCPHLQS